MSEKPLKIAMYPWFALGHIKPFLLLANKFAKKGHEISFILSKKAQSKFESFNRHKDLITFIPIDVPSVDGLPAGAETTNDLPYALFPLLIKAMDLTAPTVESILFDLKPHFVFYDFSYWLPAMARKMGIKSLLYCVIGPATIAYPSIPKRKDCGTTWTETDLLVPHESFPPSKIKLSRYEARFFVSMAGMDFGGLSFSKRIFKCMSESDVIGFKTCKELEGPYANYIGTQFGKPVIFAGPVLPEPPRLRLEEKWETLLGRFKPKSMIFCAFGSECILKKEQFQELVLGFELTGLPFFVALKPPIGEETLESALPEGFEERVRGRGFFNGGWVQQLLILKHPSIGCFVTHCGFGSLLEGLVNECQLVFLPHVGDQWINARLMEGDLRVGVEVEKGEEDGLFTRESVCKAVKDVMDEESEVGKEVRENHAKLREFLTRDGLENSYIDEFIQELHRLSG